MLKQLIFLFLPLGLLLLTGCEPNENNNDNTSDEATIEALVMADATEENNYSALPPAIEADVAANAFETFVETIERVEGRGYILQLGNGEVLYYSLDGRRLEYRSDASARPIFGLIHPHGRCFRRLVRFGRLLPPAELSTAITAYIGNNYPGDTIRAAKAIGDTTLVLISGPTVLTFGAQDQFLGEWNPLEHCTDRCTPVRPTVQTIIGNYVTANFPTAAGFRICGRLARVYALVRSPEGRRIILVFDREGSFLFSRP